MFSSWCLFVFHPSPQRWSTTLVVFKSTHAHTDKQTWNIRSNVCLWTVQYKQQNQSFLFVTSSSDGALEDGGSDWMRIVFPGERPSRRSHWEKKNRVFSCSMGSRSCSFCYFLFVCRDFGRERGVFFFANSCRIGLVNKSARVLRVTKLAVQLGSWPYFPAAIRTAFYGSDCGAASGGKQHLIFYLIRRCLTIWCDSLVQGKRIFIVVHTPESIIRRHSFFTLCLLAMFARQLSSAPRSCD